MRGIVPPDARRAVGQDRNDRIPDAAEIAAINATHFADTALKAADLLFVFGTWQDIDLRAAKGVRTLARGPLPMGHCQRRRDLRLGRF